VTVRALTVVAACAALIVAVSGCGSSHQAAVSTSPPSAPAAISPSATSTPSAPAGTPTVHPQPSGVPVPNGFKAASVTFVSANEAFVLGTAPSSSPALLRTLDHGLLWVRLPAPAVAVGSPAAGSASSVWGTRFASPSHGFVFGHGLWETTDGGGHWTLDSTPSGSILSLATIDGQVLALTAKGTSQGGLGPVRVLRRPLGGGSWSTVASLKAVDLTDPTDLVSTQAGSAAILDGTSILVTTDGGVTVTSRATPSLPQYFTPAAIAVTSGNGLALLCVGQGYAGHTQKLVYVSANGGLTWSKAGAPSPEGDGGTLAGSGATLVLATASAASWLDHSTNGGHAWATSLTYGDGGLGWADLGFTTPSNAVVIHGPARSPSGAGRPGRLLLSSDGGASWRAVTF
jgi:hypothetical protein